MTIDPPGVLDDIASFEDRYSGPINEAFRKIRDASGKIGPACERIADDIGEKVQFLSPLVVLTAKEVLRRTWEAIEKVAKLVNYALEAQVPILSLIRRSVDWLHQVREPVSDLSVPMTDPAAHPGRPTNVELGEWSGAAADTYRRKAGVQQQAVNELTKGAGFISGWLQRIAESNVEYVTKLAGIVGGILGQLVDIAAKTGSVFRIPSAIDDLVKIPGTLVEEGIKELAEIGSRFVRVLGDVREIDSSLTDRTAFPGLQWPQAVTQPR